VKLKKERKKMRGNLLKGLLVKKPVVHRNKKNEKQDDKLRSGDGVNSVKRKRKWSDVILRKSGSNGCRKC